MRKTQIVVTVGPRSFDEDAIREMVQAGADVVRKNLSHARAFKQYPTLRTVARDVRRISRELGRPVEIMVDCPGHKIRLGDFYQREISLGDGLELTADMPENGDIPFSNKDFLLLMRMGQEILIGDGMPQMKVIREATSENAKVLCQVTLGGMLSPNKGVTVRGLRVADLHLPALTEEDEEGLKFAVEIGADEVVMSYGTSAAQLAEFTKFYRDHGGKGRVVFKYELADLEDELPAIVAGSDGGFVGQGDLGLAIPAEQVPGVTAKVVRAYRAAGKPCTVGTQLLTTVKTQPFATHGESAGIYYLISIGATALMLSDETSTSAPKPFVSTPLGKIVEVLRRLIYGAESFMQDN